MIDLAWHERVAVVTLERREKRNALNIELCDRLRNAVGSAIEGGARVLVLTGGGTSFCAGADLDVVAAPEFHAAHAAALRAVADAPIPVIAAVNGPAIGAGTQLAIAADLRVAGPEAVFALPTARLGIAVDPWTIRRFAQLAGGGAARAVLLGCARLDVEEARRCGLVDRLGGLDVALAWAAEMADLAPRTLAYSKLVLDGAPSDAEHDAYAACWSSADAEEGLRARSERRPPRYTGQ
ncbi:enoyl-CoA hydratase [Pseudonocardia sp. MH-G8]|nr:enoyl-CoA hydratase [Pseudonocardia sp. MH-G8]